MHNIIIQANRSSIYGLRYICIYDKLLYSVIDTKSFKCDMNQSKPKWQHADSKKHYKNSHHTERHLAEGQSLLEGVMPEGIMLKAIKHMLNF